MFAVIMIAQREVERQTARAQGREQGVKLLIVAGLALVVSAIAADKQPGGSLWQVENFIGSGDKMLRHVDLAGDFRRVGGDVGVGKKHPGVRIGAAGGGEQFRRECQSGPGEERAFQETAARERREMNRHGRFLRPLHDCLKEKNAREGATFPGAT